MSDVSIVDPQTGEVETLTEEEALEYSKIDRIFKKFGPRRDELNAKIKRVFNTKGKRIVGPVVVSVTERASKDVKAAQVRYPQDKFPQFYEMQPVFQFDRLSPRQQKPFLGTTLALSVDILADDSPEA